MSGRKRRAKRAASDEFERRFREVQRLVDSGELDLGPRVTARGTFVPTGPAVFHFGGRRRRLKKPRVEHEQEE